MILCSGCQKGEEETTAEQSKVAVEDVGDESLWKKDSDAKSGENNTWNELELKDTIGKQRKRSDVLDALVHEQEVLVASITQRNYLLEKSATMKSDVGGEHNGLSLIRGIHEGIIKLRETSGRFVEEEMLLQARKCLKELESVLLELPKSLSSYLDISHDPAEYEAVAELRKCLEETKFWLEEEPILKLLRLRLGVHDRIMGRLEIQENLHEIEDFFGANPDVIDLSQSTIGPIQTNEVNPVASASVGTNILEPESPSTDAPAKEALRKHLDPLKRLKTRIRTIASRRIRQKFKTAEPHDGWVTQKGQFVELSYRITKDRTIMSRARGIIRADLWKVLCVLNETQLSHLWTPYCESGETIKRFSLGCQLFRQIYCYPVLGRVETVMFASAINCLATSGCIEVCCGSPDLNCTDFFGVTLPAAVPKLNRIKSTDLVFLMYPLTETRTLLEIHTYFELHLRWVPCRMIAWIILKAIKTTFVNLARNGDQFDRTPFSAAAATHPEDYQHFQEQITEYLRTKHLDQMVTAGDDCSLASFDYNADGI